MHPLRKLDLLKGDGVWKSCKGVLFFGPPATGEKNACKGNLQTKMGQASSMYLHLSSVKCCSDKVKRTS